MKLTIVMYHYIRDYKNTLYPNIKGLDLQDFNKQIEYFRKNYNFITLQDIYNAIYHGKKVKENPIYLTFDDGYAEHFHSAFPILKKYDIEGLFSIPVKVLEDGEILDVNKIHMILAFNEEEIIYQTLIKKLDFYRDKGFDYPLNDEIYAKVTKQKSRFDTDKTVFIKRVLQTYLAYDVRHSITEELFKELVVEKENISREKLFEDWYLTKSQIETMKNNNMVFASHGYNHEWLCDMTTSKMQDDIDKSTHYWTNKIDIFSGSIKTICYPYGSYDDKTISYVREKGYELGFGTKVGMANLTKENSMILERFDTNDFYPKKRS